MWATAMWSASKDLVDCASLEWVRNFVNVYADDCHCASAFWSAETFEMHLGYFGCLLDLLASRGLRINIG